MPIEIGHIESIFRYPVKSMAGERLDTAHMGWHGIDGDRRFALRRIDDRGGFPWLSAGKLPALVLYAPVRRNDAAAEELPRHVRTPAGDEMPIFSEELANDIGRRYGSPVQMMQMKQGVFDEGAISVIATETMHEIGRLAGVIPDVRRFRPNIAVRFLQPGAFQEDQWVGGVLTFGTAGNAPAIAVTLRDERCSMLNLDPDSAAPNPAMLKAVVRVNGNNAGIYGTVIRTGQVTVGQPILLHPGPS